MAKPKSDDGNLKASEAPETAVKEAETDALAKIRELSIQRRAEAGDVTGAWGVTWWFGNQTTDEIAEWWSEERDRDLRDFWMRPGNDILQGAVSSMTKKFRAMNWVLEGPKADNPDEPPPGTVDYHQQVLAEAELGQGWGVLLTKSLQDYFTQDKGMFWELIGDPDPTEGFLGPVPEPGVRGIAHLDAAVCQLTGDPVYPVLYHNPRDGKPRKLHATRVAHASDLTSPRESMNGVGFCGVSRVIGSSQVLLKLNQYKNEKLSDLPEAGLLLLNNILPKQWEDARANFQRERRRLNQELWVNVMTLIGLDPAQPVSAELLSFANLPDAFDEVSATNIYVNIVALAFGVDVREFWPLSAGPLGTAAETLVQHQKARGKGVGEVISTIERIINWKVLPPVVSFRFEFKDDEEELQRAEIDDLKTGTIMAMWAPPKIDDPELPVVTRAEIRQMLADNVSYFLEDFLREDVTEEGEVTDVERRGFGPRVVMDRKGAWRPAVRRKEREREVDLVLDMVEDNYRKGLVAAEDLAEFAVVELMDRRRHGSH
jgi:hypothetical protein